MTVRAQPATGTAHPMPPGAVPAGMYVYADSQRKHIVCSGSGAPTVLLESGLGSTALDWVLVQPLLDKHLRVCSYDRSGYGWSGRSARARLLPALTHELHRLLLMAGEKPPYVLVGHSFGGLIAQYYAREFDADVAALVLVDSMHHGQFDRFDAEGIATPQAPSGGQFFIRNFDTVPAAMPDRLKPLARYLAARPKAVEALYSELRNLRTNARLARQLPADEPAVRTHVIARAAAGGTPNTETLHKEAIWQALQRDLAAHHDAELTLAATSDHYIHLIEPQTVAQVVLSIVRTLR